MLFRSCFIPVGIMPEQSFIQSGIMCPSMTSLSLLRAKSLNTCPRYFLSWPYIIFLRYLGIQTTCYLHSQRLWVKLKSLFMKVSPCEFERFTAGGTFIYSLKCQTLVSPPAKPGVYLRAIIGGNRCLLDHWQKDSVKKGKSEGKSRASLKDWRMRLMGLEAIYPKPTAQPENSLLESIEYNGGGTALCHTLPKTKYDLLTTAEQLIKLF